MLAMKRGIDLEETSTDVMETSIAPVNRRLLSVPFALDDQL